eukprot:6463350-Amphidinium_carterae.1
MRSALDDSSPASTSTFEGQVAPTTPVRLSEDATCYICVNGVPFISASSQGGHKSATTITPHHPDDAERHESQSTQTCCDTGLLVSPFMLQLIHVPWKLLQQQLAQSAAAGVKGHPLWEHLNCILARHVSRSSRSVLLFWSELPMTAGLARLRVLASHEA